MCNTCGCAGQGKNTQLKFFVKGYDEGSAKQMERTLLGLPGVYHVHIHAHDGETTIDYNPEKTTLGNILGLFTQQGLEAVI
ncbi:MAG: hypothetical protein ACRCZU_03580 [Selenomonadaceae bacterium]|jgi:Zn-dependent membrane protease YugP